MAVVLQVETRECIDFVVQRPLELCGTEQLVDRRRGKRLERRIPHTHGIDLLGQRGSTGQRIVAARGCLREDDVGLLTAGEAGRVDAEPALRGCRKGVIQSQIAGDEIGTAVVIEIAGDQRVPAAARAAEPHGRRDVAEAGAVVLEELERHPFTGRHQIEPAVPVEVDPHRRRDHAVGPRQLGNQ